MGNKISFKGKGPGMVDMSLYELAGINPFNGLPTRMSPFPLHSDILRAIRIIDEQDAVNRFEWENLPSNINSQELERLLYYKGNLIFFKFDDDWYFMPYALDGTIDFYGRYNRVHPVPMTSGKDDENQSSYKNRASLLSQIKLNAIYNLNQVEEGLDPVVGSSKKEGYGVILRDYTNQLQQTNIPRQQLNDCFCQLEADIFAYMNTALVMGTGISGVRVPDDDSKAEVVAGAKGLKDYAKAGIGWVPIQGSIEFQELTHSNLTPASEYFLSLQSVDNFRLSTYGLDNSGVFEKQAHILSDENQINQQKYHFILEDGLTIREKFCEIANKLFEKELEGKKISVKIKEGTTSTIGTGNEQKDIVHRVSEIGGPSNDGNA